MLSGLSNWFEEWFPSPLALAILITLLTFLMAIALTLPQGSSPLVYALDLGQFWQQGLWSLLAVSMQMTMMLVLSEILANTPSIQRIIKWLIQWVHSPAKAAVVVTLIAMVTGLVNWALSLIVGAIAAREVGERAKANNIPINYPLLAACGYTGMMIWHGGLSGSAPLKLAESNHFMVQTTGVIPLSETIFSTINLVTVPLLLLTIPLATIILMRKAPITDLSLYPKLTNNEQNESEAHLQSKLEPTPSSSVRTTFNQLVSDSPLLNRVIGSMMLISLLTAFITQISQGATPLSLLTFNTINVTLFGLVLLSTSSLKHFSSEFSKALESAAGILIQYPLYGGIAALIMHSGLIDLLAGWLSNAPSTAFFYMYTFFSAGIVNFFVPSGGGQLVVQGPIIIQAAELLDIPVGQAIMALVYGDQTTNMMQPFWTIPLMAITGTKAQEIMPYAMLIMLVGGAIFMCQLIVFSL